MVGGNLRTMSASLSQTGHISSTLASGVLPFLTTKPLSGWHFKHPQMVVGREDVVSRDGVHPRAWGQLCLRLSSGHLCRP